MTSNKDTADTLATQPVKLHVGYIGQTRDGRRVTVKADPSPDEFYKFMHGKFYLREDGRLFKFGEHSPHDIIGPWREEPTQPEYETGKWYGWNGGSCPVHLKTQRKTISEDTYAEFMARLAKAEGHRRGVPLNNKQNQILTEDQRDSRTLAAIKRLGPCTVAAIGNELSVSRNSVQDYLRPLVRDGRVLVLAEKFCGAMQYQVAEDVG